MYNSEQEIESFKYPIMEEHQKIVSLKVLPLTFISDFPDLGFLYFQILVGRTWPPQTLASGAPDCEQVPFVQHRTQKIDNSSHIEFSLELFDQIENKSLSKNYHIVLRTCIRMKKKFNLPMLSEK